MDKIDAQYEDAFRRNIVGIGDTEMTAQVFCRHTMRLENIWYAEVIRDGKVIDNCITHNMYTYEGMKYILDVALHGSAQITPWYVVPFNTNTQATRGMTYAVPVFTESANYSEATRPEYTEAAATNASNTVYTTNVISKAIFTCNAGETIYGAGLVGGGSAASTKSNTVGGGKLLCAARFGAGLAVDATVTLSITIQCNIVI